MNQADHPVDLLEKIEYLHQKIDYLHAQAKQHDKFERKMKFIEYIDNCIEKIYTLDSNNPTKERVHKKYEEYYSAEENHKEKSRIEKEKQELSERLQGIKQRQKNIEIQALRIELDNSRILKQNILEEANTRESHLREQIYDLNSKVKAYEKEIQRLAKLNQLQGKQIDTLKEERNRAEKTALDWRQRYESEIGLLETFKEKKAKYVYRNQEGLRILRTITNSTNFSKGCQRLILCDLPLKFHVIKIVYGIKVGMVLPSREVVYFQEVSLYEKEEMEITNNEALSLTYLKRKVVLRLDKYKLNRDQVILMLFGKGDSVAIDESE